jgi:hypothetical protein
MSTDPISVVNRWIAAYNAGELDVIREICADDLVLIHHNRGFRLEGPDAIVGSMEEFTAIGDNKAFGEPILQVSDGETVTTLHPWGFDAKVDIEPFQVKAGETVALDLASIWTVKDGKIVEYHDIG